MSDYYTESQMQRIEQAAYDGATLEAGKEWERQRYEFGATEAELAARIAELEAEVTKCHELQDSYCDRIAELEAENAGLKAVIDQLIEAGEKMFTTVIAAADSYDEGMREWDKIVNDWKEG